MELSERIKTAMDAIGWKPSDLSKASGIEKSQLHYILSGKTKNPRIDMIIAIAHALGVDYNYLLGWDEKNEAS